MTLVIFVRLELALFCQLTNFTGELDPSLTEVAVAGHVFSFYCSYLFWSDIGTTGSAAKIERSNLAGNNRTVLVSPDTGQNIISPTTLVIDFNDQRLYWLDAAAGQVGSCNFDGTGVVAVSRSAFTRMSSMALYKVTQESSGQILFYHFREISQDVLQDQSLNVFSRFLNNPTVNPILDFLLTPQDCCCYFRT